MLPAGLFVAFEESSAVSSGNASDASAVEALRTVGISFDSIDAHSDHNLVKCLDRLCQVVGITLSALEVFSSNNCSSNSDDNGCEVWAQSTNLLFMKSRNTKIHWMVYASFPRSLTRVADLTQM